MGIYKYNDPPEIKLPVYPVNETVIRGRFKPRPKISRYILDKLVIRRNKGPLPEVVDLGKYRAKTKTRSKRADLFAEWTGADLFTDDKIVPAKRGWLKIVQDKEVEIYHSPEFSEDL